MQKKYFYLIILILFVSCNSLQYDRLINKATGLMWTNSIDDTNEAIMILDEAISLKPKEWKAYSYEIQIYCSWNHFSDGFKNNQEGVKQVFDKWISEGNSLNLSQTFCYANTLYTLDEYEAAKKYYEKILNGFFDEKTEADYVIYILTGGITGVINKENYYQWEQKKFGKEINEYLLQEIIQMEDEDEKKELLITHCAC